jgi:hypothetical protein
MKEYIKLTIFPSHMRWIASYRSRLSFCKDSNHKIKHRENDLPSSFWSDGYLEYCYNGTLDFRKTLAKNKKRVLKKTFNL